MPRAMVLRLHIHGSRTPRGRLYIRGTRAGRFSFTSLVAVDKRAQIMIYRRDETGPRVCEAVIGRPPRTAAGECYTETRKSPESCHGEEGGDESHSSAER